MFMEFAIAFKHNDSRLLNTTQNVKLNKVQLDLLLEIILQKNMVNYIDFICLL